MHVVLCQSSIENLQPARNRSRVLELLRGASIPPRSLVVLPELFSTGIIPEGFDVEAADIVGREDRAFLAELARQSGSHILGTTVGSGDSMLLNTSLLFDPTGAEVCEYRKIHPYSLGGEDKVFQPGDGIVTREVEGFFVQFTICYDLRFPELFRAGMRRGATLATVQANWPETRQFHWETLLRARAIENQCFVAGVNCVGTQLGLRYVGGSALFSPKGEIVVSLGAEAGVAVAEASPQMAASWRKAFPVLPDRKPEEFWK